MTNYPQKPNIDIARAPQGLGQRGPGGPDAGANRGMGENPLADPGIRMVLAMSPQDGAVKPLPADLNFDQLPNGSVRVSFPDGSVRELIPGASGEGRMITTLADGTRIQSDLTFGEGQVSVSSISSTGEKTLLSLNENGANMQRVTADGEITNFIPESASELIESYREAEAFAQAEELRQQEFQESQEFGDWNNYGKPADWQPEQNWQPPQFDHGFQPPTAFMPPHDPYAGGIGIGSRPELQEAQRTDFQQDFGQWNNNNGAYFQPPTAFMPPHNPYAGGIAIGSQPELQEAPRTEIQQGYGQWNNYGKPADWQPEENWQPPQGDYFQRHEVINNLWVDNSVGSWVAPTNPNVYQQPEQWQPQMWSAPAQALWQPQFNDHFNDVGYAVNNNFWSASGNYNQSTPAQQDVSQQAQAWQSLAPNSDIQYGGYQIIDNSNGFPPPPFADASGFPIAADSQETQAIPLTVDDGYAEFDHTSEFGNQNN